MSRTLLSNRLKQLEAAGLITTSARAGGKTKKYKFTKAGEALSPIVVAMAEWGQQWIDVKPSLESADTDFLMWDIRRNVKILPELPERFVVQFHFPDAPNKKKLHWLVFESGEVDLCYIDPGFVVDVQIESKVKTMVKVWMGWLDFSAAVNTGELRIEGPPVYTRNSRDWLGLSSFSHLKKQPVEVRVLRHVGS